MNLTLTKKPISLKTFKKIQLSRTIMNLTSTDPLTNSNQTFNKLKAYQTMMKKTQAYLPISLIHSKSIQLSQTTSVTKFLTLKDLSGRIIPALVLAGTFSIKTPSNTNLKLTHIPIFSQHLKKM